jgi:hypothetical protein
MSLWLSGRMTGGRHVLRVAALAVLGISVAGQALALDCPVAQPLTRPGVLQETPAQISELSNLLATGDLGNRIPMIVSDLRARYPGVENAELVNYLVTAYCPVVARLSGVAEQEKQAQLDQFVGQVMQVMY